ncbi:LSU ribosomal protein L4p (L1e) [hydrothermal vent metagenome]|uniref:LSU ribosomal protein L4p (L1e) n=1 Tax=hydrothermal vent metagenome TaxID=652676 RepID=A0A3B0RW69_9ZZZZ
MKTDVQTLSAKKAGTIDLSDDLFGLEPRADILHRMVNYQRAKRQAGTHNTLSRGEVSRTGAKFGNQKGGGTARHGSKRAGIFIGGAKAFGPKTRSHAIGMPKKMRALALRHALSSKAKSSELIVLDNVDVKSAKTKDLQVTLSKLGLENALIIDGAEVNDNFAKASRNIMNIDVLPVQGINTYDILRRHKLVLTKAAVEALEARYKGSVK